MKPLIFLAIFLTACGTPDSGGAKAYADAQKSVEEARKTADEAARRADEAEKKLAALTPPPAAPAPQEARAVPIPVAAAPVAAAAVNVAAPPRERRPAAVLAAGTPITIRTTSTISSKTAHVGDTIPASLSQAIVIDGNTVAPAGADATLRVTSVDDGGRVKGRANIEVSLASFVDITGRTRNVTTGNAQAIAKSSVKKDALKTGIASGIGAAIGAIAGGGKGAAIGAGAGAAGGAGVVLATKGNAAEIPSESLLTFTLVNPLRMR